MFCTQCGQELRDGMRFCTKCGATIKTAPQPVNVQPVAPQPVNVVQPVAPQPVNVQPMQEVVNISQPEKKKGVGAVVAIIIVLIVIILALIGVSFLEYWMTGGKEAVYETLGMSISDDSEDADEKIDVEEENVDLETEDIDAEVYSGDSAQVVEQDSVNGNVEEVSEEVVVEETVDEEQVEEVVVEEIEEPSEYILEDSDSKYLTMEDLEGLTAEECRLARNELYARHGRKFADEGLQNHFNSCSWYQGTIDAADFKESMLSDVEVANRDLIVEYEKEMGYR